MKHASILVSAAFSLSVGLAHAAEHAQLPPNLEPIEEPLNADVPEHTPVAKPGSNVTVKKYGDDRIEEFRLKGRLYMVKVYPARGLPYTLVDDHGDGVFNRYDGMRNSPAKNAQWNIISW